MIYAVFQFGTPSYAHVQQNRTEIWVLVTVSKNVVILAFSWQKSEYFFRLIALWQENAAKAIAMQRQNLVKGKIVLLLMR